MSSTPDVKDSSSEQGDISTIITDCPNRPNRDNCSDDKDPIADPKPSESPHHGGVSTACTLQSGDDNSFSRPMVDSEPPQEPTIFALESQVGEDQSPDTSRITSSVSEQLLRVKTIAEKKKRERLLDLARTAEWAKSVDIKKDTVLNGEESEIVSIKGMPMKKIKASALIELCKSCSISVSHTNRTKQKIVLLLLQFIRGIPIRTSVTDKRTKARSNSTTHPPFVQRDGTIYRVILALTCEEGKDSFLATGSRLSRNEVDNGLGHGNSLAKNLTIYLNKEHEELQCLGYQCNIFLTFGIPQDICLDFDVLDIQQFMTVVDHVQKVYRHSVNKCRTSGNHSEYSNYIGHHYWLMLFRERTFVHGGAEMKQISYPELTNPVSSLTMSKSSDSEICSWLASSQETCSDGTISSPKKRSVTDDIADSHALRKKTYMTMERQKSVAYRFDMVDRREELTNKIIKLKQQLKDPLALDEEDIAELDKMLVMRKRQRDEIDKELENLNKRNH